jgi:NDP-sugar pyrophosphorylase family protein
VKIRHALIMAAGRGQRMMPLTELVPKPMAPYKGSTLIGEGISRLTERIENIHITVGYKGAMLAQHVVERGVRTVFNTEGKPNSWWIYNTLLRALDEPMYVLTCDNVVELDFDLLERDYRELGSPACMLVPVKPVAGLEGDYIFHEAGSVTDLDRQRPSDIYCSGIQILNPHRVSSSTSEGEDFYSVWRQLIAARQLMVSSVYPKAWLAVDTWQQVVALNEPAKS